MSRTPEDEDALRAAEWITEGFPTEKKLFAIELQWAIAGELDGALTSFSLWGGELHPNGDMERREVALLLRSKIREQMCLDLGTGKMRSEENIHINVTPREIMFLDGYLLQRIQLSRFSGEAGERVEGYLAALRNINLPLMDAGGLPPREVRRFLI